jgi:hypothetical protein
MNPSIYAIFTMSSAMVHLTNVMFFVSFFIWALAAKLLYLSWLARDTDPISTMIATQRKRHCFMALGMFIMAVLAVYLYKSADDSFAMLGSGIHYWMMVGDPVKWVVVGSVFALPASVLVAAILLFAIYAHPADLAFRKRNGAYEMTGHVRGYAGFPNQVTPAVVRGTDHGLSRVYLPGNRPAARRGLYEPASQEDNF